MTPIVPRPRSIATTALAGAFLATLGVSSLFAQQPTPAPAPPPPAATQPAAPAASLAGPSAADSAWWNRRVGDQLAVTAPQRKTLDALLAKLVVDQQGLQDRMRETRESVRKAIEAGDWPAARRQFETQAAHAASLVKLQGEAQIAVLMTLSVEQRRNLSAHHHNLLTAPLVRSRIGRPLAEGEARPAPAPAPANPRP